MIVVTTVQEYENLEREGVIGFVPTMGALHSGHISLVERCRRECDTVVASIFVNPTQFNDPKDLERYPRTLEADVQMLAQAGVDVVFAPTVEQIYPEPDTRVFDFGDIERVMEGACRPGHFNGVAQVVSRLFEIVKPDKAYFGEKDYQQLAIIRLMTEQLGVGVEIVGCRIVRHTDGLALSSRNMLLTKEQRAAAPEIYKAISAAATNMKDGTVQEIEQWVQEEIDKNSLLKCEYVTVADAADLQAVRAGSVRHLFVAVRCGEIRLIDNIAI